MCICHPLAGTLYLDHSRFVDSCGSEDSNPHTAAGKEWQAPPWDEFIMSAGQLGQLIMLLSRSQGGQGRNEPRREKMWGVR